VKSRDALRWFVAASVAMMFAAPAFADCGSTHGVQPTQTKIESGQTMSAEEKPMDIVDTAVAAGSFNTLVTAVKAAGLVEVLKGEGPFTVFAPTDEAFAKLPKGTVEDLLKPENKAKLQAILTYHVIAGRVMSQDVVKLESAKTVQGQDVGIQVVDGKVKVDGALVTKADIETSNGVIHVIDAVILPRM
jgi:transforming growth factor-beta-induced protein